MRVRVDDVGVAIAWAKLPRIARAAMGRFLLLGWRSGGPPLPILFSAEDDGSLRRHPH
jgi:hypothetical protein